MNDKYVVFKRDDFDEWLSDIHARYGRTFDPPALSDAVVIRRQDLFASPALYAYANNIGVAAQVLRDYEPAVASSLQKIADYFAHEAHLAADEGEKLPD